MSPTTGDDSESNNDSAPERPHESLYRRTDGEAEGPSSPTPRHFESALSRPDEAETGFGWLFRPDPQERSVAAEADISTAGRAIPPIPGADRYGQISEATLAGALAPAALPSAEPPAAIPPDAMPPAATPPKATAATRPAVADRPSGPSSGGPWSPRRRRRWWLWVLIALVVLVVAGLVVFRLFGNGSTEVSSPTNPTTSSSAAPQQSTSGATPYAGSVAAVVQQSAAADCQAPDARDDGGAPVRYAPGNVSDGDPATAWRCDGAAEGSTLTLTLPGDTLVAEVGVINGYTKIDPKSGVDRYGEYRRVTQVSWIFDDGTTISQTLTDGVETLQRIRIDPVKASSVQLRIDSSTDPGSSSKTRDAVLISEVSIASPT